MAKIRKTSSLIVLPTLLAFTLIFVTIELIQAGDPSDLDSTFGEDGIVITNFNGEDKAYALEIQQDGKMVAIGQAHDTDFAAARYDMTGNLDIEFDGDGKVTTGFTGTESTAVDVYLLPSGKIILAGRSGGYSTSDFTLVRYDTHGNIDFGFGVSGVVTTDIGLGSSDYDSANQISRQPDGKLVVTGYTNQSDYDFAVTRYQPSGTLDPLFGSGGITTTDLGDWEMSYAHALQDDGKILVVGRHRVTTSDYDVALVRYDTNGGFDPLFGSGGFTITAVTESFDVAYDVEIQPDGKIVICGMSNGNDILLARYDMTGTLDSSFGSGGIVTTTLGETEEAYGLALQEDGKIVVVGIYYTASTDPDFLVARYEEDGELDLTFDGDGIAILDINGNEDYARDVEIRGGNIIVAGYSSNGIDTDFTLVRFIGDAMPLYLPMVVKQLP